MLERDGKLLSMGKFPGLSIYHVSDLCLKLIHYKSIYRFGNLLYLKFNWNSYHFLPVDEVGEALQMNPKDFKEKYNEVKPSKSDSLVFSCLAGVRSKKAMDTAVSLGFNRYIDGV